MEVLYVEDNPDYADIFTRVLKKLEKKYTSRIVTTGVEALDLMYPSQSTLLHTRDNLKVLLLDINLPGMSGFDILKHIRSREQTRYLPIVIFTTSSYQEDIKKAYALGASAYVIKPGGYHELMDMVQPMLEFWIQANTCIR